MKTELKIINVDGVAVVYLKGDIDNSVTVSFREQVDNYIIRNNIKGLILDFKEVSFVDSSGIGFIIGRYNLMKKESGFIRLSSVNSNCYKIFYISGITRLINCFENVDDALRKGNLDESYRIKI